MGLSGAKACLKYLMFAFNFLFFLMGCAILGIGIWLKVEKDDFADISSKYSFLTAANISIAVGVLILVVAFLGCCGAIMENTIMLMIFFICMFVIFALEMAAGGIAYVKRGELEDSLKAEFKDAILEEYGAENEEGVTLAIDAFQKSFHCCGIDKLTDWLRSDFVNKTKYLPKSCCKEDAQDCPTTAAKKLNDVYYTKPCYPEVEKFLKENLLIIGAVTIAFGILQIFGMIFAMILYCAIRDNNLGTMA